MQQQTALSTFVYAPDNVGFTHTSPERFTYFSESGSGQRTTFGLSCEELNKLLSSAAEAFATKYNTSNDQTVKKYLKELRELVEALAKLEVSLNQGTIYSSDNALANGVIGSGHIPIILSSIMAAEQYNRAARSVTTYEVTTYFSTISFGGRGQAREYLVKQDMMKAIAAFRSKVNQCRGLIPAGASLTFCNELIGMLDDKIIKPNQKSLPLDCEQFDLFETFVSKVYSLWCQMPTKPEYESFNYSIKEALKTGPKKQVYTPYYYQESVSEELYKVAIRFLEQHVGINKDSVLELTEEQDDHLLAILPLIEYLNSEQNPFARDGLFGKPVSNPFHEKALKAYEGHESMQKRDEKRLPKLNEERVVKPVKHAPYNDDQIVKLLFGSAESAKDTKGSANSGLGFFGRLLLDGATSKTQKSDSERRREVLALPMPERYLMLTHTPLAAGFAPAPAPTTAATPKVFASPVAAPAPKVPTAGAQPPKAPAAATAYKP